MPKFPSIHSKHVTPVGIVQLSPIHIAMRTYCAFVLNDLKLCSHAKVRKESDFLCFSRRCVWKFLRQKFPEQSKITTERNTTKFGFVFVSAFVIQVSCLCQNCYGGRVQNSRCKLFAKDITHPPEHIYAIKNYSLVLKLFSTRNNTHVIPLLKWHLFLMSNVMQRTTNYECTHSTSPVKSDQYTIIVQTKLIWTLDFVHTFVSSINARNIVEHKN